MATTDADGLATVSSGNVDTSVDSVTFQVASITHATLQYDAGANSDPDCDSDGTTIIDLAWTDPGGDEVTVDIWRKGFGFYPEYDDAAGNAIPPRPAARTFSRQRR